MAQASRLWTLEEPTCAEVLCSWLSGISVPKRADGALLPRIGSSRAPLRMAKAAVELIDIEQRRRLAQA